MKKQTWQQWARACAKNPESPSKFRQGSLGVLTGQDTRAIGAFVASLELYACSDDDGVAAAIASMRALLQAMQPQVRWIAREIIPFVLDWGDRERLWQRILGPSYAANVSAYSDREYEDGPC